MCHVFSAKYIVSSWILCTKLYFSFPVTCFMFSSSIFHLCFHFLTSVFPPLSLFAEHLTSDWLLDLRLVFFGLFASVFIKTCFTCAYIRLHVSSNLNTSMFPAISTPTCFQQSQHLRSVFSFISVSLLMLNITDYDWMIWNNRTVLCRFSYFTVMVHC